MRIRPGFKELTEYAIGTISSQFVIWKQWIQIVDSHFLMNAIVLNVLMKYV